MCVFPYSFIYPHIYFLLAFTRCFYPFSLLPTYSISFLIHLSFPIFLSLYLSLITPFLALLFNNYSSPLFFAYFLFFYLFSLPSFLYFPKCFSFPFILPEINFLVYFFPPLPFLFPIFISLLHFHLSSISPFPPFHTFI